MADNDLILKDYSATPQSFNPRVKDRGNGVRENVNGLSNAAGTQINPATVESIAATGPGGESFSITPSDTVNFAVNARSIYVGAAGDISIVTPGGITLLFKAVPVGSVLPQTAKRVNVPGTTASSLIGLA